MLNIDIISHRWVNPSPEAEDQVDLYRIISRPSLKFPPNHHSLLFIPENKPLTNMRVIVGDETGLLKSVKLEDKKITRFSTRSQSRERGVEQLCWADPRHLARRGGSAEGSAAAGMCGDVFASAFADGVVQFWDAGALESPAVGVAVDTGGGGGGDARAPGGCVGLGLLWGCASSGGDAFEIPNQDTAFCDASTRASASEQSRATTLAEAVSTEERVAKLS